MCGTTRPTKPIMPATGDRQGGEQRAEHEGPTLEPFHVDADLGAPSSPRLSAL